MGSIAIPESCLAPEELYRAMREGVRVTTSQASVFERHQLYEKILSLCPRALYLCVGSVFTGNYEVVSAWKESHDPQNRLTVIDTGLASGKLGLAAIVSARHSITAANAEGVRMLLGTVPVEADGSAHFRAPARTPWPSALASPQ